jgi:hypothetical protein
MRDYMRCGALIVLLVGWATCGCMEGLPRDHSVLRSADGIPRNAAFHLDGIVIAPDAIRDAQASAAVPRFVAKTTTTIRERVVDHAWVGAEGGAPPADSYRVRLHLSSLSGCREGWFPPAWATVDAVLSIQHGESLEVVELSRSIECKFKLWHDMWIERLAVDLADGVSDYIADNERD